MYPVSRRKKNKINFHGRFRVLIHDINNKDGQPWTDLLGNPLKLIWNICKGEKVLCRGKVAVDGWIDAKLREPLSSIGLILRVGPPASGKSADDLPLPPSEAEFEWFESYVISPVDETSPVDDPKGMQLRLNMLGFHAGNIDGDIGPIARAALSNFQDVYELPDGDESDSETQDILDKEIQKLDSSKPV